MGPMLRMIAVSVSGLEPAWNSRPRHNPENSGSHWSATTTESTCNSYPIINHARSNRRQVF